ncbi:MAG: TolC family protein [Armatimonadetes bacterium]|nr:TolC family protein [Armatimonadota bacterium]
MARIRAATAACVMLLAWVAAEAQQPANPGPLSLEQAMRTALQMRPTMEAAQAGVDAARAAVARSRSRTLPSAELYWDWSTRQNLARPINVPGGTLVSGGGRTDARDAGISVGLTLYDSTTRPAVRQARAAARAARHRLEDTRRELTMSVAQLYLTALGQEQLAEVAASAVLAAQRHLQLVDATIEAGTAAAADRYPVQVQLAQARLNAATAESALARTLADLRATIGLPPGPPLKLSERLAQTEVRGEVEDLIAQALATRPDVLAQREDVQTRRWSLKLARAQAGLSCSVTAQGDWGRHTGVTGESWVLGTGVSYPLFDRGAQAEVCAAEADYRSAQAQLAELELAVRREVEQEYLRLNEAAERINAARVSEESARSNLEAAEARYREGVAIVIEVTDADQSLREAQADRVQALYDHNLAHVRLMNAMGLDLLEVLGGE